MVAGISRNCGGGCYRSGTLGCRLSNLCSNSGHINRRAVSPAVVTAADTVAVTTLAAWAGTLVATANATSEILPGAEVTTVAIVAASKFAAVAAAAV